MKLDAAIQITFQKHQLLTYGGAMTRDIVRKTEKSKQNYNMNQKMFLST